MLRKQAGNMYGFVTHTYNAISGKCPHDCSYCYMKIFSLREMHLNEKELSIDLGSGNFIFVGSGIDMFAKEVPMEWINKVLAHCCQFDNTYLFQSKNPARFFDFLGAFPQKTILGTTLESNRYYGISKAPTIAERAEAMKKLHDSAYRVMISIEPVLDFDIDEFKDLIKGIHPEFVSIGADSKNHKLPEPTRGKINEFVAKLSLVTEIRKKDNLERLVK